MSELLRRIALGEREIILLGTAHVSEESIQEVESVIRNEKPDCVCVELDEGRYKSLTEKSTWETLDIVKVIKERKGFLLIANLVLASFQRKMGLNVGVQPGDEMKAAINTAHELDIKTEMVDRPIQITLKRAWAQNGIVGKSKILASLLASAFSKEKVSNEEIEKLKQKSEMDAMLEEVAQEMPSVKGVLIDERDLWLGTKIWEAKGKKVLAVLGAGHLNGTEKQIRKLEEQKRSDDLSEIARIPEKSKGSKIFGFVFPIALLLLLFAPLFISGNTEKLLRNFLTWIIWNGGLAAVGTLVAWGNILTIITAFVCAPIATLNPLVGIGLFTALVQAAVNKPQVRDMMSLVDDISSLRGWYTNRIAKVLLVFLLSSLGAVIGNIIAVPALIADLW